MLIKVKIYIQSPGAGMCSERTVDVKLHRTLTLNLKKEAEQAQLR